MITLAGDIGGTKVHLALCEIDPGVEGALPVKLAETKLPTASVADVPGTLLGFVKKSGLVPVACALGVAGWVRRGRVQGVNLPWPLAASDISRALGDVPVLLLNDLAASGHGVALLGPEDLLTLQTGEEESAGNRALVSPGTGLGECLLYRDGCRHRPIPSEGGLASFAPSDEAEAELWQFLFRRRGRVSCEDVVSGPGLVNIYVWLRDSGRVEDDCRLSAELGDSEPAAEISRLALDEGSVICRSALEVWVRAFGAEAGNVALRGLTTGGIYLGGGIVTKVGDELRRGGFLEAFAAKSAHEDVLHRIPIHVIRNAETPLLGAAVAAGLSVQTDV